MRRSRLTTTTEHTEAVSRRLATLSAELAAVRREPQARPDEQHTRIRGELDAPAPVVLPVPGRHASRRLSVGALQLGPVHLAVVSVVAALAVGIGSWAVIRDQAEPVPVPELAPATTALTSVTPSATGDAGVEVTVDVAGKVRRPGIAVLPSGSRVVDALEAAGGARRGVDLTALNLARPLVDGEQVLVGVSAPTGVAGTLGTTGTPGEAGPLVNINTADPITLESLPGVGPVTAAAIIGWRTDNGAFTAVDELLEVDGIGEATLAELAPHVTI